MLSNVVACGLILDAIRILLIILQLKCPTVIKNVIKEKQKGRIEFDMKSLNYSVSKR